MDICGDGRLSENFEYTMIYPYTTKLACFFWGEAGAYHDPKFQLATNVEKAIGLGRGKRWLTGSKGCTDVHVLLCFIPFTS